MAETRNHPIAEALGVTGVELWVQDERDFFNAANLFARMQSRGGRSSVGSTANPRGQTPELHIAEPESAVRHLPGAVDGDPTRASEPCSEGVGETGSSLEEGIEEMLECESELVAQCASLRSKMLKLGQGFAGWQAAHARESETKAAAQRKLAEEVSGMQSALERERTERKQAEEQLERERVDWQQQLKSHQDHLNETQEKLVALELQREEDQESLAKVRAQVVMERDARVTAEQARTAAEARAESAAEARSSLEKQLLEQKQLEQEIQAHVASLNSLYSKFHGKKDSL